MRRTLCGYSGVYSLDNRPPLVREEPSMRSHWCLPFFLIAVAAPPSLAQTVLWEPTVYRLDAGSSFQHGCLDPDICEVPE